jgi:hypothetical protein
MRFLKATLKGVKILHRAQSFDGGDFVAVGLHGKHQTGADWLSIEQDCARAANAVLAADVGSRQTEVVPDKVAQQKTGFDRALVLVAVHRDGNGV